MNAIKLAPSGALEAYAIRFGSANEADRFGDYFTPQTNLMLSEFGFPRPILLEHGVTREGDAAGVIGQWHSATKDSVGVKMGGQLNTAHPLYPRLSGDIRSGRYYLSSDSAAHLVKRRQVAPGRFELVKWGLLTASLTKSPAEPRLLPAAMVKALALKAGAPAGKAQSSKAFYADVAKAYGQRYANDLHREILLEEIHEIKLLAELDELERM